MTTDKKIRIMVVDDHFVVRMGLKGSIDLEQDMVVTIEAPTGEQAVALYRQEQPDIVLMDITMPQMEGIEAADRIVRQHPEARVVMVSSVGYQENIVAALQKGARHFVQKPVKPEVLYEVIKYVMGEDAISQPAAGTNGASL